MSERGIYVRVCVCVYIYIYIYIASMEGVAELEERRSGSSPAEFSGIFVCQNRVYRVKV